MQKFQHLLAFRTASSLGTVDCVEPHPPRNSRISAGTNQALSHFERTCLGAVRERRVAYCAFIVGVDFRPRAQQSLDNREMLASDGVMQGCIAKLVETVDRILGLKQLLDFLEIAILRGPVELFTLELRVTIATHGSRWAGAWLLSLNAIIIEVDMHMPTNPSIDPDVIAEAARFRAMSPQEQMQCIRKVIEDGARALNQSPNVDFLRGYQTENKEIGRRAVKHLIAKHICGEAN